MGRVQRLPTPIGVSAVAPLQPSANGGSGSFMVRCDDGSRYWCKTTNNLQDVRVPVNEQIVARLGSLIGSPVCAPQLVYIPKGLAGWKFRADRELEEGWAHGSLAAEPAVETRDLSHRASDDNARRHAGIYALFDWLGGSDPQWLTVGGDLAYHSHDHGHYFPGGPNWSAATLAANVGVPFTLGHPTNGLDTGELVRLADALEAVTEEDVLTTLANIPSEWPVTDDDLDALLDFILARRGPVADRLRSYAQGITT